MPDTKAPHRVRYYAVREQDGWFRKGHDYIFEAKDIWDATACYVEQVHEQHFGAINGTRHRDGTNGVFIDASISVGTLLRRRINFRVIGPPKGLHKEIHALVGA